MKQIERFSRAGAVANFVGLATYTATVLFNLGTAGVLAITTKR